MNIAIIGTGWGARVQVPIFRSAGLNVLAIAGSDPEKTQRTAERLEVPVASADWRSILERADISLVSITTPPDLHSEMAIAALAAGKHVLCEKPTALNADQAGRMLAQAQAHPQQLALIDHELRFLPGIRKARRMIDEGTIGQVRHVLARLIGSGRANPSREWNWWSDAIHGGGLLGALGSHQIDLLRYLLGTEVTSAAATLNTFITNRPGPDGLHPVTSDDYCSLRLRLSNGALASLEASAIAQYDEPDELTIYGDNGTLRWRSGRLLHATPGQPMEDITSEHEHQLPPDQQGDYAYGTVYLAHALRAFLAGDHNAVQDAATFRDGLQIQQALDAARRSHQQGGGYIAVEVH